MCWRPGWSFAALSGAAGASTDGPVRDAVDVHIQLYNPDPAFRGDKYVSIGAMDHQLFYMEDHRGQDPDGFGLLYYAADQVVRVACRKTPPVCRLLTGVDI